jgi:nicotinate-nucleotide--dimethylbenzimidazole phosphoribosyltransferase
MRDNREHMNNLCKPLGSLGVLEDIFVKIANVWGGNYPDFIEPKHIIFASNNGVAAQGVSACPWELTETLVKNTQNGDAVISTFCRANHIDYFVVDVGVDPGTKDFTQEKAMNLIEFNEVRYRAERAVLKQITNHANLISFGELGIGNTTTSSAVLLVPFLRERCGLSRNLDTDGLRYLVKNLTGPGANGSRSIVNNKVQAIIKGYSLHKDSIRKAYEGSISSGVAETLMCLGGYDIVAMTYAMLQCYQYRVPFIIDGFIASVAYLCAYLMEPKVQICAIPSHLSNEPGARIALDMGGIRYTEVPIHARLCLGEGTGAVLMVPIIKAMKTMFDQASTLQDLEKL